MSALNYENWSTVRNTLLLYIATFGLTGVLEYTSLLSDLPLGPFRALSIGVFNPIQEAVSARSSLIEKFVWGSGAIGFLIYSFIALRKRSAIRLYLALCLPFVLWLTPTVARFVMGVFFAIRYPDWPT